MKRLFAILTSIMLLTLCCTACSAAPEPEPQTAADEFVLTMQIGNPTMTVNGTDAEIDPGRNTAPVLQEGRTLVPIRAIIEAMGGAVDFDGETNTAFLSYQGDIVTLAIGNTTAFLNEEAHTLDVAPALINDRTMLPIRFIAESFKFGVDWNNDTQTITITKATPAVRVEPAGSGKTLIVYYSATNTTEGVAEKIADYTGGTLFELEAKEPYTDDDLDWTNQSSRVVSEHENPDTRHTELVTTTVPDWDSYDTVYLGAPIWWGEFSWVIDDFVKNNDFSGKTVIPFCTSMSSSLGDSAKHVAEMASGGNWLDGKRFGTRATETEVQEWIDSLNLSE